MSCIVCLHATYLSTQDCFRAGCQSLNLHLVSLPSGETCFNFHAFRSRHCHVGRPVSTEKSGGAETGCDLLCTRGGFLLWIHLKPFRKCGLTDRRQSGSSLAARQKRMGHRTTWTGRVLSSDISVSVLCASEGQQLNVCHRVTAAEPRRQSSGFFRMHLHGTVRNPMLQVKPNAGRSHSWQGALDISVPRWRTRSQLHWTTGGVGMGSSQPVNSILILRGPP